MVDFHEANRIRWEHAASNYKVRRGDGWRRCLDDPTLGLEGNTLQLIDRFVGSLSGKRVCVLASGDNWAAFALAGLGAHVTSVDFSQEQLNVAAARAEELGLSIEFIQADITKLTPIKANQFDFACSIRGVMVWIASLEKYYTEVFRILKPNGVFILYDIHPFGRPWNDYPEPLQMKKTYFETGPIESQYNPDTVESHTQHGELPPEKQSNLLTVFNFHWTISDLLNAMIESGLELKYVGEEPDTDPSFWHDPWGQKVSDTDPTDWKQNPRVGLPAWLTLVARKRRSKRTFRNKLISPVRIQQA